MTKTKVVKPNFLSLLDLDDLTWNDKGETLVGLTYPLVSSSW